MRQKRKPRKREKKPFCWWRATFLSHPCRWTLLLRQWPYAQGVTSTVQWRHVTGAWFKQTLVHMVQRYYKNNPRSTAVVLLFVGDSFQTSCVCSICVIVPVCSCVSVDARVQMLWCMCQHFIRELIITLLHVCDSRITISSCCIVFAL